MGWFKRVATASDNALDHNARLSPANLITVCKMTTGEPPAPPVVATLRPNNCLSVVRRIRIDQAVASLLIGVHL